MNDSLRRKPIAIASTPIVVSIDDPAAHELRRIAKDLRKQKGATAVNDRAVRPA